MNEDKQKWDWGIVSVKHRKINLLYQILQMLKTSDKWKKYQVNNIIQHRKMKIQFLKGLPLFRISEAGYGENGAKPLIRETISKIFHELMKIGNLSFQDKSNPSIDILSSKMQHIKEKPKIFKTSIEETRSPRRNRQLVI